MARIDELLRASVQVFAESGYAAAGIREIGLQAGLNSATLYHYAASKEQLLVTVMRACLTELLESARREVETTADPRLQLGRVVAVHVGLCAANPPAATVTDQEVRSLDDDNRAEVLCLRDAYEGVLQRIIARGIRAGQFDVHDARLTRLAVLEMCNGVAHWYRPEGRLTVPAAQRAFVGLACRLVGADELTKAELASLRAPVRLSCEPIPGSQARRSEVPA